jgi:hypothetical protein
MRLMGLLEDRQSNEAAPASDERRAADSIIGIGSPAIPHFLDGGQRPQQGGDPPHHRPPQQLIDQEDSKSVLMPACSGDEGREEVQPKADE